MARPHRDVLLMCLVTAMAVLGVLAFSFSLNSIASTRLGRLAVYGSCVLIGSTPVVVAALIRLRRLREREDRRRRCGQCERCGYDLRESRGRCPECGVWPIRLPEDALTNSHQMSRRPRGRI